MALGDSGSGKTVVLASADAGLRQRLRQSLAGMRWQVREAAGGAEAMAQMEEARPEALVMDSWLPDLEAGEFAGQVPLMYPGVDVLRVDGDPVEGSTRSPRRHELLHALREAMDDLPGAPAPVRNDGAAWSAAPVAVPGRMAPARVMEEPAVAVAEPEEPSLEELEAAAAGSLLPVETATAREEATVLPEVAAAPLLIPEMIGRSKAMVELARLIRLVAPRSATVLIEGETGAGKEVVAQALHRLSPRASKPFAVLNCAAIPEALLEAELFGHTRGAFTGAVQSRTGRIEAAHGGTLFLDEIGEMPLALQAKMLRFLECGELQRNTIDALARLDAERLEALAAKAERASAEAVPATSRKTVEVRALRNTLLDLLRTTDENLRLLRGLQRAHLRGIAAVETDAQPYGGTAWER